MNQKGLEVRYTIPEDAKYLKEWLTEEDTAQGFPMADTVEIDDAVARWIAFYRFKCSLTILKDGVPCGMGTLYLQPYRQLAHQCEFGIIVGRAYRGQGVGTQLMNHLLHLAKERFKIELIHLQVFSDNHAIRLYERFGFKKFGEQKKWCKADGVYKPRIFMEREL